MNQFLLEIDSIKFDDMTKHLLLLNNYFRTNEFITNKAVEFFEIENTDPRELNSFVTKMIDFDNIAYHILLNKYINKKNFSMGDFVHCIIFYDDFSNISTEQRIIMEFVKIKYMIIHAYADPKKSFIMFGKAPLVKTYTTMSHLKDNVLLLAQFTKEAAQKIEANENIKKLMSKNLVSDDFFTSENKLTNFQILFTSVDSKGKKGLSNEVAFENYYENKNFISSRTGLSNDCNYKHLGSEYGVTIDFESVDFLKLYKSRTKKDMYENTRYFSFTNFAFIVKTYFQELLEDSETFTDLFNYTDNEKNNYFFNNFKNIYIYEDFDKNFVMRQSEKDGEMAYVIARFFEISFGYKIEGNGETDINLHNFFDNLKKEVQFYESLKKIDMSRGLCIFDGNGALKGKKKPELLKIAEENNISIDSKKTVNEIIEILENSLDEQ